MIWNTVAVLFVLWLLGYGFHVGGHTIHLVLVLAGLVAVLNFTSPRKHMEGP